MFHLALTFGLQEDPVAAVEYMVGFVESVGRRTACRTRPDDRGHHRRGPRVGFPLFQ